MSYKSSSFFYWKLDVYMSMIDANGVKHITEEQIDIKEALSRIV